MPKRILSFALCVLPFAFRGAIAAVPDGYVVRVDSAVVYLDWGNASDVHAGDRFHIYRPGAELKHPVTGEVLGHAQVAVADGSIDHVDAKFSTGKIYQSTLTPVAGDRTHYEEVVVSSPVSATPVATFDKVNPSVEGLTEIWRSDPLIGEAVGVSVADIDGDGHSEIVVATLDRLDVYRITDKKLVLVTTFKSRMFRHCLGIETGDPGRTGHVTLFATLWQDSIHRPSVAILRWDSGKLKQVGEFSGFVRSMSEGDGSEVLVWQNISNAREKTYSAPSMLVANKDSYKAGSSMELDHVRDDQLFGFTHGDWAKDFMGGLAVLEGGETLRVFLKSAKWNAPDLYGGTKNSFTIDDSNKLASFSPRLLNWQPPTGPQELIVPRNAESDVRLSHFKFYKKSDITAFTWNGSEMVPLWREEIPSYLADMTIGDGMGEEPAQLWTAAVISTGKTILLAYRLP